MNRVDQSCSMPDVASEFEDQMSVPEPQPQAPAAAPEPEHPCAQQSTDVFTPYEPGQSVAPEPVRIDNPRKFDYPIAPELELKPDPSLSREEAAAGAVKEFNRYAKEYRAYIAEFKQAMERCTSWEQLRALEPERPSEWLVKGGGGRLWEDLKQRHAEFAELKTRLEAKLQGRELPGTFSAGVDVEVGLKVATAEVGAKGSVEHDSRGTRTDVKDTGKVGVGGVGVGADTSGKFTGSVKVAGQGAKVSSDGTVTITPAKAGLLEGSVAYNPKQAKVGVAVSVGVEKEIGPVKVKATGGAHGALKGVSQEDAKRALDGSARPTGDDVAAKFLYEQQLRAQLKR